MLLAVMVLTLPFGFRIKTQKGIAHLESDRSQDTCPPWFSETLGDQQRSLRLHQEKHYAGQYGPHCFYPSRTTLSSNAASYYVTTMQIHCQVKN